MKLNLPSVFVLCSGLLLASCCTEHQDTISIRIHNASDKDYSGLKVDPTASNAHFIQIGDLAPGDYTGYIEVSHSFAYPIIDVSCFYSHYTFVPSEQTPVISNEPGEYTYHINFVPTSDTSHALTVTQSED